MNQGAFVVVFTDDRTKILLHQRRDFRVWSLPGGAIEPGETPEQAAIREALEETGYEIKVERFVGEYLRPQIDQGNINYLFVGYVVGGSPIQNGDETVNVGWLDPLKLPIRRTPTVKLYVTDTLAHFPEPFKKVVNVSLWERSVRRFAFFVRDFRRRNSQIRHDDPP